MVFIVPTCDLGELPVEVVVQIALRVHQPEFENRLGEPPFNTLDINHDTHPAMNTRKRPIYPKVPGA